MEVLVEVHLDEEQRAGRITNRHVAAFPGIILHTKIHKCIWYVHAWNARIPVKLLWHCTYVDLFVARTNWTLAWASAPAPAPSGLANLPAWARLDSAGIKIGDLHCENICSVSYELQTHTHTQMHSLGLAIGDRWMLNAATWRLHEEP